MARVRLTKEEQLRFFRMIWWMRRYPVHAAWLLAGIQLAAHQRISFREMWHRNDIALMLSRGMSKTFLDALYAVLRATLWSHATQIALTRGFRGGKLVLREGCESIISGSLAGQNKRSYLIKCLENFKKTPRQSVVRIINKDPDLWSIKWSHGSDVKTGPLGKDANKSSPLRGQRATESLILDESNDIDDDMFTSVIRPFARVAPDPIGGIKKKEVSRLTKIESGTIRYDWQRYTKEIASLRKRIAEGDKSAGLVEFNYEDSFYWVDNKRPAKIEVDHLKKAIRSGEVVFTYRINLEDVMSELGTTTSMDDFLSENKNIIQSSEGAEFSSQLLEEVSSHEVDPKYLDDLSDDPDSPLSNKAGYERMVIPLLCSDDPCVLGIDVARESDDTAFVLMRIGSKRKCNAPFNDIVHATSINKAESRVQHGILRWYLKNFPGIVKIVMDKGGGGLWLRDLCWRPDDGGLPIYDPSDPDTPHDVKMIGNDILEMNQATNESNSFLVNFIRAQFEGRRVLIPPFLYHTGNDELDKAFRDLRKLKTQFTFVLSKASGLYKRYYVEGGRKKDLFNAALLASKGLYDLVYAEEEKKEVLTYCEYV